MIVVHEWKILLQKPCKILTEKEKYRIYLGIHAGGVRQGIPIHLGALIRTGSVQ
jgi:hypothetical protein